MRDGLADAEGVADGKHEVADHEFVRIGEVDGRELLPAVLDAQHGEIGAAVLQHDLGLELALVGERNLDLVGALDDVVVGDDEAGSIDHHAGAERTLHLFGTNVAGRAEEAAEEGIVEGHVRHAFGLPGTHGGDIHHGGCDHLGHLHEIPVGPEDAADSRSSRRSGRRFFGRRGLRNRMPERQPAEVRRDHEADEHPDRHQDGAEQQRPRLRTPFPQ